MSHSIAVVDVDVDSEVATPFSNAMKLNFLLADKGASTTLLKDIPEHLRNAV
jgi:hypothetical protein